MDEMKIESKWTARIVSRIIRWVVRRKFGCDVNFYLNNMRTTIVDGKTHLHLDLDLEFKKEEIDKLLEKYGI